MLAINNQQSAQASGKLASESRVWATHAGKG
jgi:hypothetical protein